MKLQCCLISHNLQPSSKLWLILNWSLPFQMASIKSMFQALKFVLVFTQQISGLREGCQSWAYTSEASSCCTIDYKRVQIPYKNIFTLFIYPLFTTNGFLTTNKHNMKIFVLAFSSPCWHLPIGTRHGKQMSLLNPKCTVLSLASRDPNFTEMWQFQLYPEFRHGRWNIRFRK